METVVGVILVMVVMAFVVVGKFQEGQSTLCRKCNSETGYLPLQQKRCPYCGKRR